MKFMKEIIFERICFTDILYLFQFGVSLQMNLVCDDAIKTSHAQIIFYGGVLVGDVSFGILSDK